MTRTPTITQMLPYSMRSEFFRRITSKSKLRLRLGTGDFLVRLKARMDARRQREAGFFKSIAQVIAEQGGAP